MATQPNDERLYPIAVLMCDLLVASLFALFGHDVLQRRAPSRQPGGMVMQQCKICNYIIVTFSYVQLICCAFI